MFLSLLVMSLVSQSPRAAGAGLQDVRCGSYCLFIALKAVGVSGDLSSHSDLDRTLGPPDSSGYSMLDLAKEAERRGVHVLAMETSLEALRGRDDRFVCITLINNNHYVLLYDVDDHDAYIIDYPKDYKLARDVFDKVWSRKCLLLSAQPLAAARSPTGGLAARWGRAAVMAAVALVALAACGGMIHALRRRVVPRGWRGGTTVLLGHVACIASSGCGAGRNVPVADAERAGGQARRTRALAFVPDRHILGTINPSESRDGIVVKTEIRNTTEDFVELREIATSCSCTEARLDRDRIPPGSRAILTTRIKPGQVQGKRTSGLVIVTSEPSHPEYVLPFEWTVRDALTSDPAEVSLPDLRPGCGARVDLRVVVNNLNICENCRLDLSSPSRLAKPRFTPNPSFSYHPHGGGVRVGGEFDLGILQVTLPDDLPLGAHEESVTVAVVCDSAERASFRLPIRWVVKPVVAVSPERISLGFGKPRDSVSRSVSVESDGRLPLRVLGVTCDGATLSRVTTKRLSATRTMVVIELLIPEAEGVWKGELHIETDREDAKLLRVPMSAYVDRSGRS